MQIATHGDVLDVSGLAELSAANSHLVRDQIRDQLSPQLKAIEIDLSDTRFLDSCGLGALIALEKSAQGVNGGVTVRLLNPTPPVLQLLELTQMHRLFEIQKR